METKNAKAIRRKKTGRTSVKECPSAFQKNSAAGEQKVGVLGQGKQNGAVMQGRASKDLRATVKAGCTCVYCQKRAMFEDLGSGC